MADHAPRFARAVLVLGVTPFAIATWSSAVTPLIAVLTLAVGAAAMREHGQAPATRIGGQSDARR